MILDSSRKCANVNLTVSSINVNCFISLLFLALKYNLTVPFKQFNKIHDSLDETQMFAARLLLTSNTQNWLQEPKMNVCS